MMWIIGGVGVLVALGLVAALLWILVFRNAPTAVLGTPTPATTVTATVALQGPTQQPSNTPAFTLATETPTRPLPTQSPTLPPTPVVLSSPPVTATAPLPPASATATPSPLPLPTMTATITIVPPTQAPSPYAFVIAGAANVRMGPAEYYPILTQVTYAQVVLLLGRASGGAWYYVQLADSRLGWIHYSLLSVSPGLTLPVVAAPPVPTPVPWPAYTPWPPYTPWPTPIPWPTLTPTPYVPTPPVVPPTSTFTPVPAPPTSTFTPVPPACSIAVGGPFVGVWAASARNDLQCPTEPMRESWTAVERFERGVMLWREDQRMIYVLASDGTWRKIADTWAEGMPDYACADTPPAGLIKPKRGFGVVWCNVPGMKSLVGWALDEEHGYTAQYQNFEGGEMIRAEDNSVYVLLRSGWYRHY